VLYGVGTKQAMHETQDTRMQCVCGRYLRSTSMLRDNGILIDAGTGVGDLGLKAFTWVNHVFIGRSYHGHVSPTRFLVATVE